MAGRQEFEMIVAAAAKKRLVNFTSSNSVSIPVNNTEIVRFYAPVNTVVRVMGMYLNIPPPAGAASGDHTVYVGFDIPNIDQLSGSSLFGGSITYQTSMMVFATKSKGPDTSEAMFAALTAITFDSISPMKILYTNNTNVPQAGTRDIRVWGIAETIG